MVFLSYNCFITTIICAHYLLITIHKIHEIEQWASKDACTFAKGPANPTRPPTPPANQKMKSLCRCDWVKDFEMGGYPVPSRGRQSNRCGAEQGEAGESEEMRGQSRGQSDGVMRLPARRMGDRDGGQSHLQMAAAAAAAAKSLQSCLTLCDPIDSSPPGSSVLGILQARILERVAISFFKACVHGKSLQSCPTLCDAMDCSLPGLPVYHQLSEFTQTHVH